MYSPKEGKKTPSNRKMAMRDGDGRGDLLAATHTPIMEVIFVYVTKHKISFVT